MYSRLITPARIHPWGSEELLEATEQDRARIVQAAPVRRLQQKTQVFPLDVKASVRSRLTHSLEVQETGRQISRRILAALPAGTVCEGLYQPGGDGLPAARRRQPAVRPLRRAGDEPVAGTVAG